VCGHPEMLGTTTVWGVYLAPHTPFNPETFIGITIYTGLYHALLNTGLRTRAMFVRSCNYALRFGGGGMLVGSLSFIRFLFGHVIYLVCGISVARLSFSHIHC
jgi:hypothetical protein